MSDTDLDKPVPPVGEEIHLPGNSAQPLLLTVGITIALIGVTTNLWIVVFGAVITIAVIVAWVRDAMREINEFPLHDDH